MEKIQPPFTAFNSGRRSDPQVVNVVRATETQYISEDGRRWRIRDGRLVGAPKDPWRAFRDTLTMPGDPDYQCCQDQISLSRMQNLLRRSIEVEDPDQRVEMISQALELARSLRRD